MKTATVSKRLYAALLVSCLLHAALFVAPYLGVSTHVSRPALPGVHKPEPAPALRATLALENNGAYTVPGISAKGESVVASPAERAAGDEQRPAPVRTEGIGLLPIPAPTYYTTDQLTRRTRPISAPRLDAPELGPVYATGTVILKLWISELGDVISVDVEKTDLPETYARTAAEAFRKVRFVPGEINGRRVGTMVRIEVTYDDGQEPPP